jgi:hypothetical protein
VGEEGRDDATLPRVSASSSGEAAARRWSSATFQGLPKLADGWTACRTLRQTRGRGRRVRSRLVRVRGIGWRKRGGGELRVVFSGVGSA